MKAFTRVALALLLAISACDDSTGPKYPDPVEKEDPKDPEGSIRTKRAG